MRSGGGASKEGVKADSLVRMQSQRGVRARGSTRLKSPKRWRNPSTRPRGPSGARGNRARSSGEGMPFGGCSTVNGAGDTSTWVVANGVSVERGGLEVVTKHG